MNLADLRGMTERAAAQDAVDPQAFERLALRLISEMPSESRAEILTITDNLGCSDWSFIADKAAPANSVASTRPPGCSS